MVYIVLHWHEHFIHRINISMLSIDIDPIDRYCPNGIGVVLVYDMLLHTDYGINGEKLHIRCGFLFQMNLPIPKIIEITHKSTILSSPALSSERIGLRYGKTNWVYVSPENQEEFISALQLINPNIKIT